MAKRCADLTMSKKLDIVENYRPLPKCNQRAAAKQLKISRGCLQNLLRDEAVLQMKHLYLDQAKEKASSW